MVKALLLVIIIIISISPAEGVEFEIPDLHLESKGVLLMEVVSGEIVMGINIHETMPPASLTKIMTLLLLMEALEKGEISLEDKVVISSYASEMGGSEIWLEQGEEFHLEDLIKAVAISSANDASVALAEHLYGSERLFVQAMNQKVQELGLENTSFGNASGLPLKGEESFITAHDIAIIARELLKYPLILQWTCIWLDYLRDGETELNNTNRLVIDYDGADGLKTGWTSEAGFCLVATAKRNGVRLMAVVLKNETSAGRFKEAQELLSFGFGLYVPLLVAKEGEYFQEVKVRRGEYTKLGLVAKGELVVAIPRGKEDELKRQIQVYSNITAPIAKGERLGQLLIYREEVLLGQMDLLAERGIKRAGFRDLLKQLLKGILDPSQ